MKREETAVEVSKILDLIERLNTKVKLDDSLSYLSHEQYDRLMEGITKLTINIYNHKETSQHSHDRLDELTDMLTSMAGFDFSKKAHVSEDNNHLDYIAIGLNLLNYQLDKQIKPLLHLKQLYNVTEEPVILIDKEYNILSINNAAEKLIGQSEYSILHTSISSLISDFSDIQFHDESTRIQLGINKNGQLFKHLFEIYTLRNENAEHTGWGLVCIDRILANTNMTELSKKYNVDLNRIQHDIMSPVKSIYGLSELGLMTKNTEEHSTYFKLINKCLKSVELHIKDLFNMLTITRSKEKKQLIHFSDIINMQMTDLNYLPGFSVVKFIANINTQRPFYSHHALISSIFHNLISNAIKYIRSNVTPEVQIIIQDEANGITIEVNDNGIGIKQEYIHEIFKPHFRATEQSEGKGLGLHILRESVNQLGGTISVESIYGSGSSFKVFIPEL